MESEKKSSRVKTRPLLNVLCACQVFVKGILPAIILSVVFLSCSDLSMTDLPLQEFNNDVTASNSPEIEVTSHPDSLSFRRLDLYLEKGSAATGDIYVVIRSSIYKYRVDSLAVPVSSLSEGASWHTFAFLGRRKLRRGENYTIYVKRSRPHDIAIGDYIAWRCSPNDRVDAYPPGLSDVNPGRISDYAFRTYEEEAIDQQQLSTSNRYFVGNKQPRWQEFVADYPQVNLTIVQ